MAFEIANRKLDAVAPLGERESVEERVAATLRGLIVAGRLAEGTQLVQRDLAERLGVSQTPVRAGLTVLAREGLVEIGSTGRAVVSRLTREDFEEIYAARSGLEGLAARVSAPLVDVATIERMHELLGELRALGARRQVDAYLERRWELHALCYRASGRRRLFGEVERLYWRSERYNRLVLSTGERFPRSIRWYEDFVRACETHDGDAAEAAVQESIRWALTETLPSLPGEADAPADVLADGN